MYNRHPYAYNNAPPYRPLQERLPTMSGPQYDPLPLTSEHPEDVRYSDRPTSPPAGSHLASLQNPETEPLGPDDDDIGSSSMRPRFLGRALQDEGMGPRQSYASSGNSVPIGDDAQSSVYGLNPNGAQNRDTSYYSLNYRDDPHDTDFAGQSTPDLNGYSKPSSPYLSEKRAAYASPNQRSRKRFLIIGALALVAVIVVVVVVAVYFTVVKPKHNNENATGGVAHGSDGTATGTGTSTGAAASASSTAKALIVTGGDGSKVTKDDGSTFTYSNSFGGIWYWDPSDPFNNGARAQSWSPALNETFNYGVDSIRG